MKRRIAEEPRRIFVRSPERKQGISGTIFAFLPDVVFALSVLLNDQQFTNSITVTEEDKEDREVSKATLQEEDGVLGACRRRTERECSHVLRLPLVKTRMSDNFISG
jgi:hypothetical protein